MFYPIPVSQESDDTCPNAQLFRHDWKSCIKSDGTIDFTILLLMYCDDVAIHFTSRDKMIKSMLIVQKLLSELSLQMHVGKPISTNDDGSTKYDVSKTEFTSTLHASSKIKSKAVGQSLIRPRTMLLPH